MAYNNTSRIEEKFVAGTSLPNKREGGLIGSHALLTNECILFLVYSTPADDWKIAYLSSSAYAKAWSTAIPGHPWPIPAHWNPDLQHDQSEWWVMGACQLSLGGQAVIPLAVWAFPFHTCCWNVLSLVFARLGVQLNIKAIYDVAMSLQCEDEFRNEEFAASCHLLEIPQADPLSSTEPDFESFVPLRASD